MNLPPNFINALSITLFILFALFVPSFPTTVHKEVQAYYDWHEAIPPGSVYVMDSSSQSVVSDINQKFAVSRYIHLWRLPIKIIVVSTHGAAGPLNVATMLRQMPESVKELKTYGVDWVWLGYNPGYETNIATFASDIRTAYPVDYYGTPLDEIPMMQDIYNAHDFYAVNFVTSNQEMMSAYVRIFGEVYNVPIVRMIGTMAWSSCSIYIPQYMPVWFFTVWLVEYEALLDYPGLNMMTYSMQAWYSLLLVVLIAVGNLAWFIKRQQLKAAGRRIEKWT